MCYMFNTLKNQSKDASPPETPFQLIQLRPLLVLTGTLRIEGGATSRVVNSEKKPAGRVAVTHMRKIHPDRKRANSLTADYTRDIDKRIKLLTTPFGALVDPSRKGQAQALFIEITQALSKFNESTTECVIYNCLVLEDLQGSRLAGVTGWVNRRLFDKDPEILAVVEMLKIGGLPAPPLQPRRRPGRPPKPTIA